MVCLVEDESAELCLGECLWKRDVPLSAVVSIGAVVQRSNGVILRVTVFLGFNRLLLLLRVHPSRARAMPDRSQLLETQDSSVAWKPTRVCRCPEAGKGRQDDQPTDRG